MSESFNSTPERETPKEAMGDLDMGGSVRGLDEEEKLVGRVRRIGAEEKKLIEDNAEDLKKFEQAERSWLRKTLLEYNLTPLQALKDEKVQRFLEKRLPAKFRYGKLVEHLTHLATQNRPN